MDPYYSSPSSYYYQPSCPSYDPFLSDSYIEPYPSYYYPSYNDQTSSPLVFYNNSTTNIYAQPTQTNIQVPSTNVSVTHSTPLLNRTFESGRIRSNSVDFIVNCFLAPPPGRRRRQRTIFSKDQVDLLDQVFEKNKYPDIQLREQLSERLDVPEARIQV